MTKRAVFLTKDKKPYYHRIMVEFEFAPGLAPSQKKKNVERLSQALERIDPSAKLLEISTKSFDQTGEALSPFNLSLRLASLKKEFKLENIYQASKVFEHGGPYYDLLGSTPLEAKRDERLKTSGPIVHFKLEDTIYPADPDTAYYTWLYFLAIRAHPLLAKKLLAFNAFSDIENPTDPKGGNQAMACCIYVSMAQTGILSKVRSFSDLVDAMYHENILAIKDQKKVEDAISTLADLPVSKRKKVFAIGDLLVHPTIGKGEVIKKDARSYTIYFKVAGPRTLAKEFVEKECRPL